MSEHGVRRAKYSIVKRMSHNHRYSKNEIQLLKDKYPTLYREQFDWAYVLSKEYLSGLEYDNVGSLMIEKEEYYPGQTCFLFKKRVFITLDGSLLSCERINRKYSLGKILNGKIHISTKKANLLYHKIDNAFLKSCTFCVKRFSCTRCFFQDDDFSDNKVCFKDEKTAQNELVYLASTLEEVL